MGTRTDAALAILVLVAVGLAFVAVDASVWWPALVLGGLGTIGFELAAARAYETVRDYWERPAVQGLCVGLALLGVVIGAWVAASSVLSFALGSLLTYLAYLVVVPFVR
ncbi:hypothetical protein [Haloterrigena alkaliphila]|uniref:Uncharacterized protein n=1 Tax=Haloterrigena alkaliphila TaxID=2816475 RepID=A0A8A2VDP6_9EURY|nr:hypothetical protein [Haloterrigena alkaliphila]QSX00170.1 hypothetical protein J0X25_04175 [Haloterrigena alkaliphila]